MRLRSLLFVPGDRPDRMRNALASGADALVLDLEDSVTSEAKLEARGHVAAFLNERPSGAPAIFVRVHAFGHPEIDRDLDAIMPFAPYGLVLPKADGAACLEGLDRRLGSADARIIVVATETPRALFSLGEYVGATKRLFGLTWGAEDLSAAVGASCAREADGSYRAPYALARSMALFAAHAAGVSAFETILPDLDDSAALSRYAVRGREDGFSGMFAIHPRQIDAINAAFVPSQREVEQARRIVDAFDKAGSAGALRVDGRMVDAPHLASARKILTLASQG